MRTVFKISDNLELRLENRETNIYVNNRLFNQCKRLLINIPLNKVKEYDDIESIDEVRQYLDDSLNIEETNGLKPEVEFFGHCSNLQAWYENDYDSCILHSNLSFPLLKKLGEFDSRARNRFDEELVKRLNSGYEPVQEYLFNEYLDHILNLSKEKMDNIEPDKIKIEELDLNRNKLSVFPELISELKNLQKLNLSFNNLRVLPESIRKLRNLQKLNLIDNDLCVLPESIEELKSLELYLIDNALIIDKRLMRTFLKNSPIIMYKELKFFDKINSALELANTLCDLSYECLAFQRNSIISDRPDTWEIEEFTINSWRDREDYYSRLCGEDKIKIPFIYIPNYPNWQHKRQLRKRKRVIKKTINKCKKDFKIIKSEIEQFKKYEKTYDKMIKGFTIAENEIELIIKKRISGDLFGRRRTPLDF